MGEHREVIDDIELDCFPIFEIFDVCDWMYENPVLNQALNFKVIAVRSGDLGGQAMQLPLQIHPGKRSLRKARTSKLK